MSNYALIYSKITGSQNKMKGHVIEWKTKFEQHNHPNLLTIHSISIVESMKIFVPFTEITILLDKPLEPLTRHKKVIMKVGFD